MKKIETELLDCYILEPDRFGDERGYFSPYYIESNLKELGFKGVVQANRSKSAKGVVRGLHFQENPKCQAKIVEVIRGSAIDVVVDIRRNSDTYGKYTAPSSIDVSQYLSVGMSLVDAINSLNTAGISYSISGGTPPEKDMNLYTVKGFTNKIKQGETVKIQVEKTQVTEPTEPSEDDTTTTEPEDGESTNVNADGDSGTDKLKN